MTDALLATDLPFPKRAGKVRDVYDVSDALGEPRLLIVATDRISAFDCVMPNGVPGKGALLTQLSAFWFDRLSALVPHHVVTTHVDALPGPLRAFAPQIAGRFVLARKTQVVPIECVARGYLAGSGWAEYRSGGTVCGIALPPGLAQGDRLPEPIFTPASKAEHGHDENVTFVRASELVGVETMQQLRRLTLALYAEASAFAATRGILIADTKFEFGFDVEHGALTLIDEILTPYSSRFWPADGYAPGRAQASFDKQFVRDWLATQPWDRTPPAPPLPADVIEGTRQRYVEAYEAIAG